MENLATRQTGYEANAITWEGIAIEVRYCPQWSACDDGLGYAHLEIVSNGRTQLPITETGYRSHFVTATDIEAEGGAIDYALKWLNEASQAKTWLAHVEDQSQGCLF